MMELMLELMKMRAQMDVKMTELITRCSISDRGAGDQQRLLNRGGRR